MKYFLRSGQCRRFFFGLSAMALAASIPAHGLVSFPSGVPETVRLEKNAPRGEAREHLSPWQLPAPGRRHFGHGQPMAGLQVAGSASAAMQEPMLALYRKLLTANQSATAGWEMERLKAWANNGSQQRQIVPVEVGEIMGLEFDEVHVHALSDAQLRELGVDDARIQQLPAIGGLIEDLKEAMIALPEGLQQLPDTFGLVVLDAEGENSEVVALLLRSP